MSGWTADDLARLGKQRAGQIRNFRTTAKTAKGSRKKFRKAGKMNSLETDYAARLEALKPAGEIADYSFECINLRLADRTFYMPDFMVLNTDGVLEIHEVKGYWTDDARVKFKVAASLFPFVFVAITRPRGEWQFERL